MKVHRQIAGEDNCLELMLAKQSAYVEWMTGVRLAPRGYVE